MQNAFTIVVILFGIVFVVVVGVVILKIFDRITLGPPPTQEQIAEFNRHYQERLRTPQWPDLERHFGRSIPESLRSLYDDAGQLQRTCYYVVQPNSCDEDKDHYVQRFEPADLQTLGDCLLSLEEKRFPFASDDFGNFYFIEMTEHSSNDCPVFFIDHDGGDISKLADSLVEFLSWKTRSDSGQPP